MKESGLIPEPRALDSSVVDFVRDNDSYYSTQFSKIQGKNGFVFSWNMMAALFGPLWGAFRGLWGFFWTFLILELFALVQLGRGLWGELGADQISRYERLLVNIGKREQQAADLVAAGKPDEAEAKLKIAENLKKVAASAQEQAEIAAGEATSILLFGLGLLLLVKVVEGLYANFAYEKQYLRWRATPSLQSGVSKGGVAFGAFLMLAIWPLTLFRLRFPIRMANCQRYPTAFWAANYRLPSFR